MGHLGTIQYHFVQLQPLKTQHPFRSLTSFVPEEGGVLKQRSSSCWRVLNERPSLENETRRVQQFCEPAVFKFNVTHYVYTYYALCIFLSPFDLVSCVRVYVVQCVIYRRRATSRKSSLVFLDSRQQLFESPLQFLHVHA